MNERRPPGKAVPGAGRALHGVVEPSSELQPTTRQPQEPQRPPHSGKGRSRRNADMLGEEEQKEDGGPPVGAPHVQLCPGRWGQADHKPGSCMIAIAIFGPSRPHQSS